MIKITLTLFCIGLLSACSSTMKEPKLWENNLGDLQEEPINSPEIIEKISIDKNVWSK